jgi:DNA-directed RNA polymerase specialized sigma24 family protein
MQSIKKYVLSHHGNEEDVHIVFDDMIVQFIKSVFSNHELHIETELNAYLMGIAKHLWYAESKKRIRLKSTETLDNQDLASTETMALDLMVHSENMVILEKLMSRIGSKCKEVLMYWAHGYNMEEIAKLLQYKSEGMVRKKKSICLKELVTLVQAQPDLKNLLAP